VVRVNANRSIGIGELMRNTFYDKSLAGMYETAGGNEAFVRISNRFHRKIEEDPVLRVAPENTGVCFMPPP
jgi:hypothetical protein